LQRSSNSCGGVIYTKIIFLGNKILINFDNQPVIEVLKTRNLSPISLIIRTYWKQRDSICYHRAFIFMDEKVAHELSKTKRLGIPYEQKGHNYIDR